MQSSAERRPAAQPPAAAGFQDLYRSYFGLVWRSLGRLGVREADRKDLTQNVFIIVHRQLPGFEGRAELTTWLWSICRLVAKDYLRSALIRREVVIDAREIAKRGSTSDGLQRLDSIDLSRLLQAILSRIPEKLRVVFVMFELDELSGDEIARLLNVPLGTVRSRLRLARQVFQRHVKAHLAPDNEVFCLDAELLPRLMEMSTPPRRAFPGSARRATGPRESKGATRS